MRGTRAAGSVALAAAGAVLIVVGALLLYARATIFDSDSFADRATAALGDDQVQRAVARPIVNAIVDAGPPELINAQPLIEGAVQGMIGSAAFRGTFNDAAREAHAAAFEGDIEALVLNLADAGVIAIDAVQSISPQVARQIPDNLQPELIRITDSGFALDVAPLAHDVRLLGIVLPLIGLALLAASIMMARDRRTGFIRAAAAIAIASGAAIALLLVARSLVLASFDDDVVHDAVAAGWGVLLDDLRTWLLVLGGGAIVLAAAAFAGVREIDPGAPVRWLVAMASWRPAGPASRVARALGLIAVSLLLVLRPEAGLNVIVVAIGGWGLFIAATELMLLVAPPPAPEAEQDGLLRRLRPGRAVAVAAAAAAAVVVAFVALGGDEDEVIARPPGPVTSCNGYEQLCDRTIDQVALAATHNSMSAAREPGWFLPNQRHGITRQLDDGIRALLIDTHYGIETEGGTVVTDIERESATREEIEAAVGPEGVERVKRIRARLVGETDSADARPYLCHVVCELGATELTAALTEVREFLDAHPDEFVVLFVEDVVTPEDAAPAFEESGLLDYAYVHQRGEPFPTLRELIEADERVLILGEMHSGGSELPWYHDGFSLVQETPYTFNSEDEIAAEAACSPNRGTAHNPVFQVNHWIEKIPRSPDLAGRVNSRDPLLARARLCERRRGLLPNLIAVDHYDRGDVVAVVDELNGLEAGATPEHRERDG